MNRLAALFVLYPLAACDQLFNIDHIDDHSMGDGGATSDADATTDGPIVPGDGSLCIGKFMQLCPQFSPSPLSIATTSSIDTSSDSRCIVIAAAGGNPDLCIIAASAINIAAPLNVNGTRALVLASESSISISTAGIINASSSRLARKGPATNDARCAVTAGAQQIGTGGGGGGAGGSFHGNGGYGGLADDNTLASPNGVVAQPTVLRGGCAGAAGGMSADGTAGGLAGDSGGALYLVAASSITSLGSILANGAGGAGGTFAGDGQEPGGGGGGSGGMIVIDAPTLSLSGPVVAHGGGGGGGGDGTFAGRSGYEWDAASPSARANGGTPGSNGGTGGQSSGGIFLDGFVGGGCDNVNGGGAGGGGGGAGFILLYGTVSQASQVYPTPTAVP